jgi:hypothetical protein
MKVRDLIAARSGSAAHHESSSRLERKPPVRERDLRVTTSQSRIDILGVWPMTNDKSPASWLNQAPLLAEQESRPRMAS